MKSKILTLFSICLLFFLLLHPDEGLLGARDGLTLWLNVMLPTLLPFLIFTGILLKAGNLTKLLNPFSLLWEKCFGLSPAGAYVLILGFLCGYPMGAKIAHDLYINDQISKKEGEYLLSFSCNASPAFVVSYLTGSILQNRIHPMQIVLILLTADLFCMLFFRFLIYHGNTLTPAKVKSIKKETYQQDSTGVIPPVTASTESIGSSDQPVSTEPVPDALGTENGSDPDFGSYIGTAGAAAAGAVIGAAAGSVLGTLAGKHPQISGKAAEHKTMKPAAKEKKQEPSTDIEAQLEAARERLRRFNEMEMEEKK